MKKKTKKTLKKKFGWKVTVGNPSAKITKKFNRKDFKIPIRKGDPKKYKQKSLFDQDNYFTK